MMLWIVVLVFVVAQNAQVALYGVVSNRIDATSNLERLRFAFKDPLFLASLLLLSVATAGVRVWWFPHAGIARTHLITSAAVVLSFAVFSLIFGEQQSASRYAGAMLCGVGILLVSR